MPVKIAAGSQNQAGWLDCYRGYSQEKGNIEIIIQIVIQELAKSGMAGDDILYKIVTEEIASRSRSGKFPERSPRSSAV